MNMTNVLKYQPTVLMDKTMREMEEVGEWRGGGGREVED